MSFAARSHVERLESRIVLSGVSGSAAILASKVAHADRAQLTPAIADIYYMFATINASTFPSTLVAGVPVTGRVNFSISGLDLTNTRRPLSISFYLADGPVPYEAGTFLGAGTNIQSGVVTVGPKQGQYRGSALVRIPAKLITAGTYTLTVTASQPRDGAGDSFFTPAYATNSQQLTVVPQQIGLSAGVAKSTFATSAIAGSRISESATLTITNTGTVTTPGKTSVLLFQTASGKVDANSTQLARISRPLRVKVGKSLQLTLPVRRIPTIQPGNYSIVAQVTDPAGQITTHTVSSQTISG